MLAATASPEAMHHPAYDDTEAAAVATMVRCLLLTWVRSCLVTWI